MLLAPLNGSGIVKQKPAPVRAFVFTPCAAHDAAFPPSGCISLWVRQQHLQPATRTGARWPYVPVAQARPSAAATVAARFPAPAGCQRVGVAAGSWGEWLRYLPLRPAGTPALHLHWPAKKDRQDVVAAVVNIDVGTQDLQQCADAVIRLRAEYVFSHDPNQDSFSPHHGLRLLVFGLCGRPHVSGSGRKCCLLPGRLSCPPTRPGQLPVPTFGYAGTLSLSRELRPVALASVQPGDVLIHGGRPGHAVLVVDVAENPNTHQQYCCWPRATCRRRASMCLKTSASPDWGLGLPWTRRPNVVSTPEWDFGRQELARF